MANNNKPGGGGAPISIGSIWFIMWLFTIGYAGLTFWKAVIALVIWPYFLGAALA
jgi:hypothetical protein